MERSQSPTRQWTYREVECRIYLIDLSSERRWIGYAKVADKWMELVNTVGGDASYVADRVEKEVDRRLRSLDQFPGDDVPTIPFDDDVPTPDSPEWEPGDVFIN